MGKCKVCIQRLTLAPGAINDEGGRDEKDTDIEVASRILDCEHHHHAMEISVASFSTVRLQSHGHGVESQLRGRFWAADSESEIESDDEVINQLYHSLNKMSISSPSGSSGLLPSSNSICSAPSKVSLGDAMEKAKFLHSPPSV
jgi:hypothetical protein